ncbi:mechanosensitive ion channel domain-containing protein [Agromyces sp. H66]|uniref:mechanosensitive ion channel family protein n=1 Tax=Agromyces sp. H66 TaxID=2529859 RepID=UPI0010AA8112|nr:mechanosensitive ion channel domain-containing protein [Agromyces sp. H66]
MGSSWQSWSAFAIALVAVVAAVLLLSWTASAVVRAIARRRDWAAILIDRVRWPFRTVLLVVGLWVAVAVAFRDAEWRGPVDHAFLIALIAAGAWLACQAFLFLADLGVRRYDIDVADNRVARRARTQLQIIRRLVVVIIVVLAIGVILFTFEGVRALGASVLASAGVASIVAGLAAQSVLANLFAGVQIAFSEAIRVDDVVVVEGEWGRVREITLTYVVVVTWDQRTVVLPCTYFTTRPFENWTRYGSALIGAVELDVDWRVSTGEMRGELDRVLAGTELWDGRTSVLQVTDATGGHVRVRVLVSANDSAALWDLRCLVREALVDWISRTDRAALPRQRVLVGSGAASHEAELRRMTGGTSTRTEGEPGQADTARAGLFSGTRDAEERASEFTQAVPVMTPDDVELARTDDERHRGRGEDG